MTMDELVEGAKIVYVLSKQEAEDINQFIANHPELHPAGTKVYAGQPMPATVVLSRGPNHAGEERLAMRLDGPTPVEKAYHVWAADLHYAAGAWHKVENGE
jgi:hypothetical protein